MGRILKLSLFLLAAFSLNMDMLYARNYYVDNAGGDDNNNGITPGSAWQSLTKVNGITFLPGDSILLKYGGIWNNQQLAPPGSGAVNKPIVIGAYGNPEDGKPILNGNGAVQDVVSLYNQEWIEIWNLEISNYKAGDLIDDPNSFKRGVYISGRNCGELEHIHLVNLYVHSVNGYGVGSNDGKDNGGIFFEIRGTSTPGWFNDFLIEGCHIYDVVRTGISNRSTWNDRAAGNWVPSHNIRIRNTIVEKAGFNGIIPRYSDGILVEHCTLINNGEHGNGNAIFQTGADNTIYQYNEAYGTVFNPEDHDAAGFDGGGHNNNTLIQYNYSHDNGLGGIVIGLSDGIVNDGARIRYNILQNNLRQAFRFSGPTYNATISNNTIYIGPELSGIDIIFHKKLGQSPDNLSYYNNLFYVLAENCKYNFGESTNCSFSHNAFFGRHPSSEPDDYFKIVSDPVLLSPGTGGVGRNTVGGYKLRPESPLVNAGLPVEGNNGGLDFWGNAVPNGSMPDIGAHEWTSDTSEVLIIVRDQMDALLEGAEVWVEGHGTYTTDLLGQVRLSGVLTGIRIPLTIAYTGYPLLYTSLEVKASDTLTFRLSKNIYNLRIEVADTAGLALPDVTVVIPGHDTLMSDTEGAVLFTDLTGTNNLFYKAELVGYQIKAGSIDLIQDDTLSISLVPRSAFFEVITGKNVALDQAIVTFGNSEPQLSDSRGIAIVTHIPRGAGVPYTVAKNGYVPQTDSVDIGNDNISVLLNLVPTELTFVVKDSYGDPIYEAAVILSNTLRWTNSDGLTSFKEVRFGEDLLYSIQKPGFTKITGTINLTTDKDTIFIEMYPPEYKVTFTITDESSSAIENALVTLSGYGVLQTDNAGGVVFQNVIPGENIIYAISKDGYKDTVNVLDVVDGDVFVSVSLKRITSNLNKPLAEEGGLKLYPMPASAYLNIEPALRKGHIHIYSAGGQSVYKAEIVTDLIRLDISGWDPGIYFIRIFGQNNEIGAIAKFCVLRH